MFTQCSVYPNPQHVRFTRLLSKSITGACGVNFRALCTHPQTKFRALNTAPTPPTPLQQVPTNTIMWDMDEYAAWYGRLSNAQAWCSERRV
jgi:hypothetical protein